MVELSVSRFIANPPPPPAFEAGRLSSASRRLGSPTTQRIFVELKAERKRFMDDYHQRYDDWLDECKKLTKEDWKPPEPQYRGPAEWELKIAEDQVKSWQWHLEMRHDKFKRKLKQTITT